MFDRCRCISVRLLRLLYFILVFLVDLCVAVCLCWPPAESAAVLVRSPPTDRPSPRRRLQETERQIRPWLLVMFGHTGWRLFALVFGSLVNDLYFAYHGLLCFIWSALILLNVYGWLVVWSFFNELTEVSKLEDIAHLKVTSGPGGRAGIHSD